MRRVLIFIVVGMSIPLIVVFSTVFAAYYQHITPLETTATSIDDSSPDVYNFYANGLSARLEPDTPLVMIVPLNGTPGSQDHISYKNAFVALQVLQRTTVEQKYLILSEGNTLTACQSGAAITAELLGQAPGFNPDTGVHILLEEKAATTVENVLFSKDILEELFPDTKVSVVVAGMAESVPSYTNALGNRSGIGMDVGHGSRALLLLQQIYFGNATIKIAGMLPTNRIDSSIQNYPFSYNMLTMIVGSLGGLYLPYFDREAFIQSIEKDGC